ncbi:Dsk2p is a nuclear-enriched protein [Stagonosporopsis vannaccii]|nr:Dsk2p is a nuclear-enriched protein [Stagonosporopsis vannaccii]
MADDATASTEEGQVTFNVKAANDQKHVLTLPSTTTVADLKTKLSSSEYADIPPERQRLIYSGRVLKDPDTLGGVKIKDGHTIHLVKGAASNARQNPANQGTTSTSSGTGTPTPQVPTNIAAGTGNNPLAGLTGARYAGFHGLPSMDMFGADGGMGPPPNADAMLEMMDNPMFLSQMNEAMNNPAVVDMMLQSPMIRNNPMLQQMLRNPEMRRMMFSPEMMRMQLQMQRGMDGTGSGSAMAAPGTTDNTPQPGSTTAREGATGTPNQQNPAAAANPFAPFGGAGAGTNANPFASLFAGGGNPFAPQAQGQGNNSTTGSDSTQSNQNASSAPPNPFGNLFGGAEGGQPNPIADAARNIMQNPQAMQQMMQMMGGGQGANPFGGFGSPSGGAGTGTGTGDTGAQQANPFAALFGPGFGGGFGSGFGGSPPPADNRPPEEVYESQLRQLNEMGFYEFDRNVSALRRSGGNVQGAIEYLLNGGS